MKNIKLIILSIITLFILINEVNAGVCKGKLIDESSGTCDSLNVKITKPSELEGKTGSYFLYPGFRATNSKGNALALCLDPGLSSPTSDLNLNYIRELKNSNIRLKKGNADFYDDGIYRIYQYFYNNLVYQNNNGGLNRSFVNQHSSYFQYASRVWTYRHGFDYIDKLSAYYKNDAANFKTCSHYIDSNLSKGSKTTEDYCFGTHKSKIKDYYNAVNEDYLWNNPIKITSSSDVVTNSGIKYYVFKFKILFHDGKYSFFDGNYSKGISFGDISLPKAYFKLQDLTVNGVSCTSGDCYNYSGFGELYEGTEKEFIVELTEEQYNNFKNNHSTDGTVNVSMKYSYQHPLNIENLYTARYDLINSYQRMLIIQNYVHEDIETIGKEPEIVLCKHTSEGFIDKNGFKVNKLEEFLNSGCDCDYVNYNLLSDSDKIYYQTSESGCFESDESFTGEIKSCNSSSIYENVLDAVNDSNYEGIGPLTYTKKTTINNYCSETCVETINIYNLKGKYTTKAGMYFEFDTYPNLIANKRCTIDIDYDKWNKKYEESLTPLKEAYNKWLEVKTVQSNTVECCIPCRRADGSSCGCDVYYYTYNTNHYPVIIQDYTTLTTGTLQNYSIGTKTCGLKNWSYEENSAWNKFLAELSKPDTITELKNNLKTCNQRLFTNDAENFYKFTQQLNYYYEQQYSNNGDNVLNSVRSGRYGIDDSAFDDDPNGPLEMENSKSSNMGINKIYNTLTSSGIASETITTYINTGGNTNEDIARNVKYTVTYNKPLIPKYTEAMTGTIIGVNPGTNTLNLYNYSKLGYGYDTDVTAIAKKGNKSYYVFSKLGDSNNKLFNNFKDNNYGGIVRMCDYEITNDLMKTSENGYFDTKLNIIYRSVDPANIDPNQRLIDSSGNLISYDGTNGFKNWRNENAQVIMKKIEEDAKTKDTYSPENLEYSFNLDSRTIAAIREENKDYKYDDWNDDLYKCEKGNKCKSAFITKIEENKLKDTSNKEITNILKTKKGRTTWKEITSIGGNKYTIDGKEVILNS